MKKRLLQVLTALFIVGISLIFVTTSVFAAGQPTVTSSAATAIGNNWATLHGEVTVVNDTNIDERGFVWDTSTHADPGNVDPSISGYANNWTEVGVFGLATFDHFISGLSVGQTVYWRACALNDATFWAYSGELSFTTTSTDRFWISGTGNWNDTAHWSQNTGGASGASVPGNGNNVYFDTNSDSGGANFTVTLNVAANCLTMDWSAVDVTPTLAGTGALAIYGSCTADAGMTWGTTGTLTFASTSTGRTINMQGIHFYSNNVYFNGVGGGWQLTGDMWIQAPSTAWYDIVLSNGTLDTNGYDVNVGSFVCNAGTNVMTLGGSSVFTTHDTGNAWNGANIDTLNPNASTIVLRSLGVFASAGLTYNDVVSYGGNINGGGTIADLTLYNTDGNKATSITFDTNITVTGTFTAVGDGSLDRLMVASNAAVARTITAAIVVSNHTDYYYITGAGAGSWNLAASDSIEYRNCTGITATWPYDVNEDIYWTGLDDGIGGGGAWSYPTPTGATDYNWSTTSGGIGGSPRHYAPQPTNNAIFDAGSGFTVGNTNVTGSNYQYYCKDIDFTGSNALANPYVVLDGSASGSALYIYGSATLVPGMSLGCSTGFTGGNGVHWSGTGTITTNGGYWISQTGNSNLITVEGTGLYTLADNVNAACSMIVDTGHSLNGGGNTVYFTSGGSANKYFENRGTCTNTSLYYASAGTFTLGGTTVDTVYVNVTRIGTNVFTDAFKQAVNVVISGTFTLTGYDSAHRMQYGSSVAGTQRQITLNGPNPVVTNTDVSDSAAVGSASKDISAGFNSDLGNNLGWIFAPGTNVYWVGNSGNWSDPLKWSSSSGGLGGTSHVPLIQDIAVFDANSFAIPGRTVTIDITNLSGINSSAVTNNPTITKAGNVQVYGSINMGTCIWSPTITYMMGQTNSTIQSTNTNPGLSLTSTLYIQKNATYMNTVTAMSNFSCGSIYLVSGIFNIGGFSVTGNSFDSATTTFTRALNLGTGTLTLQDTGAITKWNVATTNFSFFETSSTIILTNSGVTAQTFAGAGLTYGNVTIGGAGVYDLTITGSNTFRDFNIDRSLAAKTVSFTNGTTTNVSNFYCNVSGVTVVTLDNTATNGIWTLRDTAGTNASDYLLIRFGLATGGATFYAGPHSQVLDGTITNNGGVITGSPVNLYEGPPNTPTVTTVGNFTVLMGSATLSGTAVSGPDVLVTGSPKALVAGSQSITTTGTAPGTISITVTGSGWLLTGPTAPTVLTIAASGLAFTTVTLNGDLTSLGGYGTVFGYFHYGTDPTLAVYSSTAPMSTLSGLGTYTYNLAGLASETQYYFQAYISDSFVDLASGAILTFTTTGNPDVMTLTPTTIGDTSATLQGTVTSMGLYSSVAVFFQYGLTISYGNNTPEQTLTTATGFLQAITGLQSNTTYHYRAAIRYNVTHYVYGGDVTFSTIGAGQPGTNAPDILSIIDAKVVTGYLTPGDQMYLVSYKAIYLAGTPAQPASEYFVIQVLNNSVVIGQWPLPQWGYQPVGLYLAPQSAPPYGGLYTIKIIGIPSKWPIPPIPEATRALTAGDWLGGDLTQLDNWVIQTAVAIGNYYNETLVTYTATGTVLNATGGALFNNNISGLSKVRPQLFSVFALRPTPKNTPITGTAYTDTWNPSTQLGPYVNGLLQDGATSMNMDPIAFNNLVGITIWLVITTLLLFGFKGSYLAALISAPVLVGVSYSGLLIPVVIVILAVLNVLLLLYALLPRGTG